jgi:hypothetical protein
VRHQGLDGSGHSSGIGFSGTSDAGLIEPIIAENGQQGVA